MSLGAGDQHGVERVVELSSPSRPDTFEPHAYRRPSCVTASECALPAATFVTPLSVGTSVGELRCVVDPSPIWDEPFVPHA